MSEAEAGFEIAVGVAKKLHDVCPEHELLNLFTKTEEPDYNEKVWEEFQVRFGKEGLTKTQRSCEPAQAYFWASYFVALRNACKERGIEA